MLLIPGPGFANGPNLQHSLVSMRGCGCAAKGKQLVNQMKSKKEQHYSRCGNEAITISCFPRSIFHFPCSEKEQKNGEGGGKKGKTARAFFLPSDGILKPFCKCHTSLNMASGMEIIGIGQFGWRARNRFPLAHFSKNN